MDISETNMPLLLPESGRHAMTVAKQEAICPMASCCFYLVTLRSQGITYDAISACSRSLQSPFLIPAEPLPASE